MNIHSQLLLNRFTRSMMFSCNALHSATCGNSESLAHVQVQTRLKRFAAADVKKGPGHPFLAGPNKCFHSVKMAGFQEAPVALMGDFNIKPGMRHCESVISVDPAFRGRYGLGVEYFNMPSLCLAFSGTSSYRLIESGGSIATVSKQAHPASKQRGRNVSLKSLPRLLLNPALRSQNWVRAGHQSMRGVEKQSRMQGSKHEVHGLEQLPIAEFPDGLRSAYKDCMCDSPTTSCAILRGVMVSKVREQGVCLLSGLWPRRLVSSLQCLGQDFHGQEPMFTNYAMSAMSKEAFVDTLDPRLASMKPSNIVVRTGAAFPQSTEDYIWFSPGRLKVVACDWAVRRLCWSVLCFAAVRPAAAKGDRERQRAVPQCRRTIRSPPTACNASDVRVTRSCTDKFGLGYGQIMIDAKDASLTGSTQM